MPDADPVALVKLALDALRDDLQRFGERLDQLETLVRQLPTAPSPIPQPAPEGPEETRTCVCPYCYQPHEIPESEWGKNRQCVTCKRFFDSDASTVYSLLKRMPPQPTVPVPSPPKAVPGQVIPFSCQHCRTEIQFQTDWIKNTFPCPKCRKPTSIYAVYWYCPRCRTRLQAPRDSKGQEVACPSCRLLQAVPLTELTNQKKKVPFHRFRFPCPACNTVWCGEKEDSGKAAVCLRCHNLFEVPAAGQPGEPEPEPFPISQAEAVQQRAYRVCPACQREVHGTVPICLSCGADVRGT